MAAATNEGWHNVGSIKDIFQDADQIDYELRNCIRGSYTSGTENEDLAMDLRRLANRLLEAAEELENRTTSQASLDTPEE